MYHPGGFEKLSAYASRRQLESCPVLQQAKELGTPPKAQVTPPDLSLPGPFVSVRCRAQLAA
jgi:hypothetical protein